MNSELRQDLVSGDWIVVAPKRKTRPRDIIAKLPQRMRSSQGGCVFENPQASGNGEPLFITPDRNHWRVQAIVNKYPAVVPRRGACPSPVRSGPYVKIEGRGYHEIFITRDHDVNMPALQRAEANVLWGAFQVRYRALAADPCLSYISIFQNWGPAAGASIYHPHYQLIALPVLPPDISHSFAGSKRYFKKNKACVHCEMLRWEAREKRRIICQNDGAIAIAPFVSRSSFEVRVFPKAHQPYFEEASGAQLSFVVDALQQSLRKIEKKLNDPDYNFFIHTAPVRGKKNFSHYHWHIEILPKISIWAGLELGTGIDLISVDPDTAAKLLRNPK